MGNSIMTSDDRILTISKIKEKACLVASSKDYIKEVYLFGSYANGTATEKSDIDIHIIFKDTSLGLKAFEFGAELENETGKVVDNVFNDEFYDLKYGNTQKERMLLYREG